MKIPVTWNARFQSDITASSISHTRKSIQAICHVLRCIVGESMDRRRLFCLDIIHLTDVASILFRDPGCLHVPLFIEDDTPGLLTALKRQIQFGFGGWWLGQRLTMQNEMFVREVEQALPGKDGPLLVACGEGLRWAGVPILMYRRDLQYLSPYTTDCTHPLRLAPLLSLFFSYSFGLPF